MPVDPTDVKAKKKKTLEQIIAEAEEENRQNLIK